LDTGISTPPQAAVSVLIAVYALAAWFNTRIPDTGVEMRPMPSNALALLPDFWRCNSRLWTDKLGQITLATTTLFWGVSGNLKYIVLAWSATALGYSITQSTSLLGVVAIGTAAGAVAASMRMRLDTATKVIPLGLLMGLLVILMNFIHNVWLAVPFLVVLGGLGGFMVVPMNALLQHRGHLLMGAGHSIAQQNFNENISILLLTGAYALMVRADWHIHTIVLVFGLFISAVMATVWLRHRHDVVH
jgi:hypothetical protein